MSAQSKNAVSTHAMTDLKDYIFTSESVSEGHPDKVCDRISDSVLDLFLAHDPQARVGCETFATTDFVLVGGEARSNKEITPAMIEEVARKAVKEIGYEQEGFNWKTMKVDVRLHKQSADIAQGVDAAGNKDEGAGDQGIMFGYACTETPAFMPAPLYYSHAILRALAEARHSGSLPEVEPDAKSQVTLEYKNNKPVRAASVVVSTQHKDGLSQKDIREIVRPYVTNILPEGWFPPEDEFYVTITM